MLQKKLPVCTFSTVGACHPRLAGRSWEKNTTLSYATEKKNWVKPAQISQILSFNPRQNVPLSLGLF